MRRPFLMMIGAAWYSRSSSLLSGGLDNLGDALTYALNLAVVGASSLAKARVALFNGFLILGVAFAVGVQIVWRWFHPEVPLFEGIGVAALLNLGANLICLKLLMPYRSGDINLASAWECSRNDVYEGLAVLAAALGVCFWPWIQPMAASDNGDQRLSGRRNPRHAAPGKQLPRGFFRLAIPADAFSVDGVVQSVIADAIFRQR